MNAIISHAVPVMSHSLIVILENFYDRIKVCIQHSLNGKVFHGISFKTLFVPTFQIFFYIANLVKVELFLLWSKKLISCKDWLKVIDLIGELIKTGKRLWERCVKTKSCLKIVQPDNN